MPAQLTAFSSITAGKYWLGDSETAERCQETTNASATHVVGILYTPRAVIVSTHEHHFNALWERAPCRASK